MMVSFVSPLSSRMLIMNVRNCVKSISPGNTKPGPERHERECNDGSNLCTGSPRRLSKRRNHVRSTSTPPPWNLPPFVGPVPPPRGGGALTN